MLPMLVLLAASTAGAALNAWVEFLGFSVDRSCAAMLERWIDDGSGAPGARLTVVSTTTGDPLLVEQFVWPESLLAEVDGPNFDFVLIAGDSLLEREREFLESLDLGGGEPDDTPVHCIFHPMTDRGVDPDRAVFVEWAFSPSFMTAELTLELSEETCLPENPPEWLSMFDPPVLLTAAITGADGEILFRMSDAERPADAELYAGERFVSDYRIRDVYLADRTFALILVAVEPGYEGPDGMHRLIAGTLGD